jgi:alkyl sulfatase BDS1-like metallo-beta-lactamase superfamily hydrolase
MNNETINMTRQGGAIGKMILLVIALVVLVLVWLMLDENAGKGLKKQARLKGMEMIGDIAASRLAGMDGADGETHGSAVDMVKRPIEVRKVSDNVYYATGVANTIMITTNEGNVLLDTGLALQAAKQLRLLKEEVSDAPVTHIVLSHSHADHIGGTKIWQEEGTEIVAHKEFEEEQRYLTELQPYFWGRNRTLFPWIPASPPDIEMMRYGGIEPTLTVDDDEPYRFSLGGVDFVVFGAPGAEGADNVVLWLPQQKMLISGDFFGPQFPQFPNVFTMRGEKVRKPMEYVASLDKLMALEPEIIVPSHLSPTVGKERIRADMLRIRDAVQYVHDETVAGMNAGRTVYQLMDEIKLPPELDLVQSHGKVDWAVKSIWEYYATWFHFDTTTELYPVPVRDVYVDLAEVAGSEGLQTLAQNYLNTDKPVKALHVLEVALAGEPANKVSLGLRQKALQILIARAESGLRNDYETYWLKSRLADTERDLSVQGIDN